MTLTNNLEYIRYYGVIVRTSKREKMETTLFYARAACDTMVRKFAAADLLPKGHFYYH